jgi:hypothetical protein
MFRYFKTSHRFPYALEDFYIIQKSFLLMITIQYSTRTQMKISPWKRSIGKSPVETRTELAAVFQ